MDRATAKRMRALRYTEAGPFPRIFIERLGLEKTAWYRAERCGIVPHRLGIFLVRRCPGITLDWIWLGKEDALSISRKTRLHRALRALEVMDEVTTAAEGGEAKNEE